MARFWGLGFGLPHTLARPDELAVISLAVDHVRGRWAPDFFDYPRVFIYLLTAVYGVYYAIGVAAGWFHSTAQFAVDFGANHWEPFYLMGRAVSAAFGTASVGVLYALGRRLFDRPVALVAAAFLAVAYLDVRNAHYATTDVAMTCLLLCAMLALVRAHERPTTRRFVLAGTLAGVATATKYTAVTLATPLAASAIIRAIDARRLAGWWPALRRSGLVTMGVAMILTFLALSSYIIWDYRRFSAGMDLLGGFYAAGNTGDLQFASGWWFHLAVSLRYGLGLPLLLAGFAGFALLAWRQWRVAVLLAAYPVSYYAVAAHGGAPSSGTWCRSSRFSASRRRCLWSRSGASRRRGCAWRPRWSSRGSRARWRRRRPARRRNSIGCCARPDSRVIAARWMAAQVAPGATIGEKRAAPTAGCSSSAGPASTRYWSYDTGALTFRNGRRVLAAPDWVVVRTSPILQQPRRAARRASASARGPR